MARALELILGVVIAGLVIFYVAACLDPLGDRPDNLRVRPASTEEVGR